MKRYANPNITYEEEEEEQHLEKQHDELWAAREAMTARGIQTIFREKEVVPPATPQGRRTREYILDPSIDPGIRRRLFTEVVKEKKFDSVESPKRVPRVVEKDPQKVEAEWDQLLKDVGVVEEFATLKQELLNKRANLLRAELELVPEVDVVQRAEQLLSRALYHGLQPLYRVIGEASAAAGITDTRIHYRWIDKGGNNKSLRDRQIPLEGKGTHTTLNSFVEANYFHLGSQLLAHAIAQATQVLAEKAMQTPTFVQNMAIGLNIQPEEAQLLSQLTGLDLEDISMAPQWVWCVLPDTVFQYTLSVSSFGAITQAANRIRELPGKADVTFKELFNSGVVSSRFASYIALHFTKASGGNAYPARMDDRGRKTYFISAGITTRTSHLLHGVAVRKFFANQVYRIPNPDRQGPTQQQLENANEARQEAMVRTEHWKERVDIARATFAELVAKYRPGLLPQAVEVDTVVLTPQEVLEFGDLVAAREQYWSAKASWATARAEERQLLWEYIKLQRLAECLPDYVLMSYYVVHESFEPSPGWSSGGGPIPVYENKQVPTTYYVAPPQTPQPQTKMQDEFTQQQASYVGENGGEDYDPEWAEEAVTTDDLYGVQHVVFEPSIQGSLEEFAKHPELTTWEPTDDQKQAMRRVITLQNRNAARAEHRQGDPSKTIFTGAVVKEAINTTARKAGLTMDGLVPRVMSRGGDFVWTVNPGFVAHGLEENVFHPVNMLTKQMYERKELINPASVHASFVENLPTEHGNVVGINVNSHAWDTLCDMVGKGHWADFHGPLRAASEAAEKSTQHGFHLAFIPRPVATQLKAAILAPLVDLPKLYTNMHTYQAKWGPADGHAWNAVQGLHNVGGAAFSAGSKQKLIEDAQTRPGLISAKIALQFVQDDPDVHFDVSPGAA